MFVLLLIFTVAFARQNMVAFEDVDASFGTEKVDESYASLKKLYEGGESQNVELLWRLAKCCQEMANKQTDKKKTKEYHFEGFKYGVEAFNINENHFNACKFAAIMSGEATEFMGTKEKIEESTRFKKYLDKALSIDDKDASLYYLRGRYAYGVASLSWLERKAAAIFYATPPVATYEEALEDFLACDKTRDDFIENLYYIGLTLVELGRKGDAKSYLERALKIPAKDETDKENHKKITALMAKC